MGTDSEHGRLSGHIRKLGALCFLLFGVTLTSACITIKTVATIMTMTVNLNVTIML